MRHPATVRLLLVGGGGGGGGDCGGGGGGGAVLDLRDVALEPGRYRAVVGAGGAAGRLDGDVRGGDGGETALLRLLPNGPSEPLFVAPGGGGGGGWAKGAGRPGASGGGGSNAQPGGAAVPGPDGTARGHAGADSAPGSNCRRPGGGGGAGGPPSPARVEGTRDNGASQPAGDGGPGLESDITGAILVYGAGGGGGAYNDHPGAGGDGLGGHGWRNADAATGDEAGRDGFGGGGGGGNNRHVQGTYRGARGGSGLVAIRLSALPPPDEAPPAKAEPTPRMKKKAAPPKTPPRDRKAAPPAAPPVRVPPLSRPLRALRLFLSPHFALTRPTAFR